MNHLFTDAEFQAAKRKDALPLRCLQCGRIFYLSKLRIRQVMNPNQRKQRRGDFCSRSCSATSRGPAIEVPCKQCHKIFRKPPSQIRKSPNHFCSRSCAARYNNTHKTKGTRVSKLERWLQKRLPALHPKVEFHFNRKDAINSELDIYIPSLRLAFELNGIFHYEPIYGPEKLANIQNNDQRKFQACLEQGIELCLIDVSRMKYFKETKALEFLHIIQQVLQDHMERVRGHDPPTSALATPCSTN